ncbi:hypothetical protein A2159_01080 [Candidatus Woesebacteria bacterium RBG_13_34_9]|uniref:HMA domain-containing protein n=1 Tax=Candidatus Woesebacteria bacterium RBG_13_34_9 TaxID=1802477 RepID=A0A1F7X8D2_9BACT|nr:MAG: hypothetical protein A2159_01080 [Candidatus Woesebacteria bacterium RBG_13_34_9]
MKRKIYKIEGMDCPSCAQMLELDLEDKGIKSSCDFAGKTLIVESERESDIISVEEILKKSGYSILEKNLVK